MLNYTRFFPSSLVLFMAPSKPLVAQQIQACSSLGLNPLQIAELTGNVKKEKRRDVYLSKNVVFCTPQVARNDLADGWL